MHALPAIPSPFEALIFDLDGTLIDSHDDIVTSLTAAFHAVDIRPSVPTATLADGSPLEEIFAVGASGGSIDRFPLFVRAYRDAYQHRVGASQLFPGVRDTLDALAAMRPRPALSIASSKRETIIHAILEALGITAMFSLVVGSGAGAFRHKPSPDMLVHTAQHLGVDPSRCLMVGDTLRDIHAARAARMPVAAVTYGAGPVDALVDAQPDFVLEEFDQLLLVLGVSA